MAKPNTTAAVTCIALALSDIHGTEVKCGNLVVGPESVIDNLAKAGLADPEQAAVEAAKKRNAKSVEIGGEVEQFAQGAADAKAEDSKSETDGSGQVGA